MESPMNQVVCGSENEIFFMNMIEESHVSEDLLCNSAGCA